jgi:uncharacterized protein (TIGR00255 family)
MPIRSMTGFAQVKGHANSGTAFTLSLKSVNHRFLDLHFRLPMESNGLEMKLRRVLKEKLARGHVEVTITLERSKDDAVALNSEIVGGYIRAFRAAATEFGLAGQPDLNVILRTPGALDTASLPADEGVESLVLATVEELLAKLNQMREQEGSTTASELRGHMGRVREASRWIEGRRQAMLQTYMEKLRVRLKELLETEAAPDRLMQEAALIVDRSDIQEELARLDAHVNHFLSMLEEGGEVGKKLDFLLQEMNREANTLLSKTSGLAGEALKVTEMGLAIKSEIEKAREQVQNIE